jgi:hypothetical protein
MKTLTLPIRNRCTIYILFLCCIISCKKSDFLDAKPKTNLVIPTIIADYQALLETDNLASFNQTPCLGDLSSDNYYVLSSKYTTIGSPIDKNAYIWAADIYGGLGNQPNWNNPFRQILNANVALDGLPNIPTNNTNQQSWNETYGFALFVRAVSLWNLAQIYVAPYDSLTSDKDLGLPLRLTPDINKVEQRSSVQQTYDLILQDLLGCVDLVPLSFAGRLNRPAKPTVYAMLSRVYLSMRKYNKALLYADSSLQLYNSLIDYNTLSTTANNPFAVNNAESMYSSMTVNSTYSFGPIALVDSTLYISFSNNDLRKVIYFRTTVDGPGFKYGYGGNRLNSPFSGISSSEIYLIRSECNARLGNVSASMADLNALLIKRWKTGTFVPLTATSSAAALAFVLTERRKELVFRSLRWMDLRRLNKEGYNIIVQRNINGQIYTLPPNSPLYVLPIPPDEIAISGIQQNPR